jgi:hypothetical protein
MNTKQGRGRPKGSSSFTRVSLEDLSNAVGKNAVVVVSKKWLQEIGLTLETPVAKIHTVAHQQPEEEKIAFSVTSFE